MTTMKSNAQWVYISGPYTKPSPVANTREAILWGTTILNTGNVAIIPHLSLLWDLVCHRPWEQWLDYDLELIRRCNLVARIPGESPGADREVARAKELNIPVVYTLEAAMQFCFDHGGY
ncbi:MAG TPA: DUF4406 domain-containing protein [Nitrospiraceae bacterium]